MSPKLIGALLAILALVGAFYAHGSREYARGVRVTTATYELAINKVQVEAARQLAAETLKVLQSEVRLQDAKVLQEKEDALHTKTVASLGTRLRDLAGPAGRLREPAHTRSGPGSGGAPAQAPGDTSPGAGDSPEAAGLLSGQLTGLLLQLTADADEINLAYSSCRADSFKVRE